uniref:Uncharacterized protein n=1 Tax=Timema tahoe TaxID=61484 RepID=A0A7R9FMJ5_9NEOP|nr:unnamed protein product [Timema tahoe]
MSLGVNTIQRDDSLVIMSHRGDYGTSLVLAVNIFLFTLLKIFNIGTAEILGNVGKVTDLEEYEPDSNEIQTHGERYGLLDCLRLMAKKN